MRVSLLADVPAWFWQVLGAVCGLGLGLWLGALRQGKAAGTVRVVPPAEVPQPAAPTPPAPAPVPQRTESRLDRTAARGPAGPASVPGALGPGGSAPPRPVVAPPPPPPPPLERPAEVAPTQPMPLSGLTSRSQGPASGRMSLDPGSTQPGSLGATDLTHSRNVDALRDANLELTAKLRAATDLHARELLERSQEQQADHLRHEKQLEDLRQAHAAELSHLMSAMVEQVDALQREHGQQIQALEQELERLRRSGQTGTGSSPDALTRPVTMTMGGDMRPPQ